VYTIKLDGHRGVYIQTGRISYIEFENGRVMEMEPLNDDVFVLDVELVDDQPVVCDVLYYNKPVYDLNIYSRIGLVTNLKTQTYKPLADFKPVDGVEGYIFFNGRLPYDRLSIYKFKYEMTVDFLRVTEDTVASSDGKIFRAAKSGRIGAIEELTMDLSRVLRERDDKIMPNHSVVMAHTDLAQIKDIQKLIERKGLSVLMIWDNKVSSQSERWLSDNVTEVSRIGGYDDDEDSEDELFDFEVMDKDGNFTPEYEEFKLRYYESKSTHEAYVKAVQPQEYDEEEVVEVEDFKAQMLLDEGFIEQVPEGYKIETTIYTDVTNSHPAEIFSTIPEIREYIKNFFLIRENVLGTLEKCKKHLQYCAIDSQCVRKLIRFPNIFFFENKKCGCLGKCVKVRDKCFSFVELMREGFVLSNHDKDKVESIKEGRKNSQAKNEGKKENNPLDQKKGNVRRGPRNLKVAPDKPSSFSVNKSLPRGKKNRR